MNSPLTRRLATLALAVVIASPALADDGWMTLFNGENLNNWVQLGGKADYTIEDNVIVGAAVPNTPNSFLCTKRHYRDFELELEFHVSPGLNSGIQIRSNAYAAETILPAPDGAGGVREISVGAGRVHGYQIEIDPSDRAWSGGIYDEGRRGWLNDLKNNEPARQAFQQNDWNHFRIVCQGDHIQTWINGVPAADLHDNMTPSGFIALQVHGIGGNEPETPLQVKWRNIRIKELTSATTTGE